MRTLAFGELSRTRRDWRTATTDSEGLVRHVHSRQVLRGMDISRASAAAVPTGSQETEGLQEEAADGATPSVTHHPFHKTRYNVSI